MRSFMLALGLFIAAPLFAALPLGTVSNVKVTSCSGLTATCYKATVSAPGVAAITMNFKVLPSTAHTTLGTVLLTTGRGGQNTYEQDYTYGTYLIQKLQYEGYRVIEIFCPNVGAAGYYVGPGGPLETAARWATFASYLKTTYGGSAPFCATGNSGGAGSLGYALSEYGLGSIFKFVEPTSGPVFSRIDYGCQKNGPRQFASCQNAYPGWVYGLEMAQDFIDPSFANADCSTATRTQTLQYQSVFYAASIDNGNEATSFPTIIKVLTGGKDISLAADQSAEWLSHITSTTMDSCIPDAPHNLCDVQDAADQIAADMGTFCVQ